jgi:hypothetical protein
VNHCERRRTERRIPTYQKGKVVLPDGSAIHCVVWDLSAKGARLRFTEPTPLPEVFRVLVPASDLFVAAEPRWSAGREVGVEFTGPSQGAPPGM